MTLLQELSDINKIMGRAGFLSKMKSMTARISSSAMVTDGEHEDSNFAVVIKCASHDYENIRRRLGSVQEITLERIADNIIGINPKKKS